MKKKDINNYPKILELNKIKTIFGLKSLISLSDDLENKIKKQKINFIPAENDKDGILFNAKLLNEISNNKTIATALFLLMYSFIEQHFFYLSKYYQEYKNMDLKLDDVTGRGLKRSQLYIKKVLKIETTISDNEWDYLFTLGKIRNKIAHVGNIKDEELLKNIKKHFDSKNLFIDRLDQLEITTIFLKKSIDKVLHIIDKI